MEIKIVILLIINNDKISQNSLKNKIKIIYKKILKENEKFFKRKK